MQLGTQEKHNNKEIMKMKQAIAKNFKIYLIL